MEELITRNEFKGKNLPVGFDYSKVQNYPELIEVLNCLPKSVTEAGTSRDKEKEIRNLLNSIKLKYVQSLKNERFLNFVKEDVYDEDTASSSFAKEIKDIMFTEVLAQYCLHKCDSSNGSNYGKLFFGLSASTIGNSFNASQNYSFLGDKNDTANISHETSNKSMENKSPVVQDYATPTFLIEVCQEKLDLLNCNAELHKKMKLYNGVLARYINLQEDASKAMLTFKEEIELKYGDLCLKKIKLPETNVKILKCEVLLSFFSEDENIIEAVNKINHIVKNEVCTVKNKIYELDEKRCAYESLSDARLQCILKEYKELLKSIDKKTWMLQSLQNQRGKC